MKKIIVGLGAIMFVLWFASCDREEFIGTEGLPAASVSFLEQHFAGVKVSNVKKEKEGLNGTEYQVYLENGTTVKFDKNGNWEEVDAPGNMAIPTSFIPVKIVDYVTAQYTDAGINSIDKEKNRYDVELTNGLDLEFNADGDFLRID